MCKFGSSLLLCSPLNTTGQGRGQVVSAVEPTSVSMRHAEDELVL